MAIKFNTIKCPECGANLPIEENRKKLFCSYCGTPIIITDENEHIYRHIDDAAIAKTETERLIYLKELEIEEKENERNRKGRKTAYTISLVLVLIGLATMSFNMMVGLYAILAGAIIAEFTFIGADKKKKKKRRIFTENEVQISDKMVRYNGKYYKSIKTLYRNAGFTNISVVSLNDLNAFTRKKIGQVEDISIGGEGDFEEGDIFAKNDEVIITYHSLK